MSIQWLLLSNAKERRDTVSNMDEPHRHDKNERCIILLVNMPTISETHLQLKVVEKGSSSVMKVAPQNVFKCSIV